MQVFIQLNSDNYPDLSILDGVIDICCGVFIRMISDNNPDELW